MEVTMNPTSPPMKMERSCHPTWPVIRLEAGSHYIQTWRTRKVRVMRKEIPYDLLCPQMAAIRQLQYDRLDWWHKGSGKDTWSVSSSCSVGLELVNLKSPHSSFQMDLWSHISLKVMVYICICFVFAKMRQMFVLALLFNLSHNKEG